MYFKLLLLSRNVRLIRDLKPHRSARACVLIYSLASAIFHSLSTAFLFPVEGSNLV